MERVRQMFAQHPNPASDAGDEAFALVQATAECAAVCTTCADACLAEDDPAAMRSCIRANLDCADLCAVTGRLIARPGKQDPQTLRAQLEACAVACRHCAEECQRHAEKMEHCRICAETCRACAEACERMQQALVG
jgi:uncharacterized membrane protein